MGYGISLEGGKKGKGNIRIHEDDKFALYVCIHVSDQFLRDY